jgi:hypothetical protein
MTGEFLANPAVIGLAGGGIIVLIAQTIWARVMGAPNEKSIPAQFAEILVRLAAIDTKLEVAATRRAYMERQINELETDFWDHMKEYHREFKPRRRPVPTVDDSVATRVHGES